MNYHLHYYRQLFCDYDADVPIWRLVLIISHYVYDYHTFQSLQIISVQIDQTGLVPNDNTLFGTGQKIVWYLFMHSNNCYPSPKFNNHLWPRYVFREQYRRKGAILQECRKHLSSSRKICKLWRSVCSLLSISSRQNYISALVNQFANQLTRMQNRFTSDCQSRIGTKLDRIGMQNQNCFKGCTSRVSIRPMQCVFHWHLGWSEVQWTPTQVQCRSNSNSTKRLSGHWGTKPRKIREVVNFILTWPPCQIWNLFSWFGQNRFRKSSVLQDADLLWCSETQMGHVMWGGEVWNRMCSTYAKQEMKQPRKDVLFEFNPVP